GTICKAQFCSISAKNRWLASGSLIKGKVRIDPGASKALNKRFSLLAVGVQEVIGEFVAGEVIEILNENAVAVAVAKTRVSSHELSNSLKKQNLEVANATD